MQANFKALLHIHIFQEWTGSVVYGDIISHFLYMPICIYQCWFRKSVFLPPLNICADIQQAAHEVTNPVCSSMFTNPVCSSMFTNPVCSSMSTNPVSSTTFYWKMCYQAMLELTVWLCHLCTFKECTWCTYIILEDILHLYSYMVYESSIIMHSCNKINAERFWKWKTLYAISTC